MGKSKEIKETRRVVKEILERDVLARNNDNHLIIEVYSYYLKQKGLSTSMSFSIIFNNIKEFGLPQIETITRERRWCQTYYPHLRADEDVEAHREINEEAFEKLEVNVC